MDTNNIHQRITDIALKVERHDERIDRHRQDIDRMDKELNEKLIQLSENIDKMCAQSRADNKSTAENLTRLEASINKVVWAGGGGLSLITFVFMLWQSGVFAALAELIHKI